MSTIAAQRRARRAIAEHLATQHDPIYAASTALIQAVIRETIHEDEWYQAQTGDVMPAHAQAALRTERAYWMHIDDVLHAPPVTAEEYAAGDKAERAPTAQLARIIALEEAMLHSPLTTYYADELAHITTGSPRGDMTRQPLRALEQLREDRQQRHLVARNTYRHLLRNTVTTMGRTGLEYCKRLASEEALFYEDGTGEAFPAHAMRANALEQRLWEHLLRHHDSGVPVAIGRITLRTLEVQDALLTSARIAYFNELLDRLEDAARSADKTFKVPQ